MPTRHARHSLTHGRLHHDLLVTHGAPAIMRQQPENPTSQTYLESGQLVIWRWLSIDRFFPPNQEENALQALLRGCASVSGPLPIKLQLITPDWNHSRITKRIVSASVSSSSTDLTEYIPASFKILSAMSFPLVDSQYLVSDIHVYQQPDHDPLVLFTCPDSSALRVLNITHLKPRIPPKFPFDNIVKIAESVKRPRTDDFGVLDLVNCLPAEPRFWTITLPNPDSQTTPFRTCVMSRDAQVILAIGTDGILWVWRLYNSPEADESTTL